MEGRKIQSRKKIKIFKKHNLVAITIDVWNIFFHLFFLGTYVPFAFTIDIIIIIVIGIRLLLNLFHIVYSQLESP